MRRLLRSPFVARRAAAASALLLSSVISTGCDTGSPQIEPDPTPGVGPGSEPEPGVGPGGDGASCAEAIVLEVGATTGNTTGASDAHKGACDEFSDEGSTGPDLAYTFTLTERSSVTIDLVGDGTYDPILYLSSTDACDSDLACSDAVGAAEAFSGNLDAGTYFVVVDTYIGALDETTTQTDGGTFTLTLNIDSPQCFDDQFDDPPTDSPAGAPSLGGLDVDTLDLDPTTPEEDSIDLFLCDAADYYLLPHMGGALTLDVTDRNGGTDPVAELFVAEDDGDGNFSEGAAADVNAAGRGNYLVKVSAGAAAPAEGISYRIVATHGCLPDEADSITVADDDNAPERATLLVQDTDAPLPGNMCDEDEDGLVITSLVPGDVILTLAGGAGFNAAVSHVADDNTLTPAVLDTDFTVATVGSDLVVTVLTTGKFFVLVSNGTTTGNVPYTIEIAYTAFADAPANDVCTANAAFVPSETGATVSGYTFNGTHTLAGPLVGDGADAVSCNGDAEVPSTSETGNAAEVFFSFSLAAPENIEFGLDGTATGFNAAMYLLEFTGNVCPADLSTLAPVLVGGAPACQVGTEATLRVRDLPAGDYLLVVDGVYSPELDLGIFVIPESTTEGAFELTATTVPGGFPLSAACTAATTVTAPGAAATTAPVDRTGAPTEMVGSCGGRGEEIVFEITPDANADVVITAGGESYDTVLYVLSGECSEFGTEVGCNDDDESEGEDNLGLGSRLTLSMVAGTTYFIVVDAYDPAEDGDDLATTLSISIAE